MKKFVATLLLLVSVVITVSAAKAVRRPFKAVLANGQTVTLCMYGDEHHHFFATQNGEVAILEGGIWRLATPEEQQATMAESRKAIMRAGERIDASRPFPSKGTPKALVIMVNFTDRKFVYTKEDVSHRLNTTEYTTTNTSRTNYSSAAQYYYDCSGGAFRPQYDVVGPFDLSGNIRYYGEGSNDRMDRLIPEACALAEAAGVDFKPYDNNGDGYVDLVCVMYAGFGANWDNGSHPEYIWPKSGFSSGTYGGLKLNRYLVAQELLGYEGIDKEMGIDFIPQDGVGLFCHEMCHTLGLPDIYGKFSYDSWYDNQSMERWDLMDGGEYTQNGFYPTPLTAFECNLLGWTDYMKFDTLRVAGNYDLPMIKDGHKAYIIQNEQDPTGNEYYVLENIQKGKANGWYRYMPGHGMLITHVNYSTSSFSNFSMPNGTHGTPRLTILPANGKLLGEMNYGWTQTQLDANWAGNPFPGTSEVTSFEYKLQGYPNQICYNGTADVMAETKSLTNITETDGIISFHFGKDTPEYVPGDANGDGIVSVADLAMIASYILGDTVAGINLLAADYNKDGDVTVSDLAAIASLILAQ